jgi:hypothetical protein
MTLHQLQWEVVDKDPTKVESVIKRIQEQPEEPASPTVSLTPARKGGRLNTKLRNQNTLQDINIGTTQTQIDSFWDRHFESEEEVLWYKFQKQFLDDYETQLSGEF